MDESLDIGDDLILMKQHFKVTGKRGDFVTLKDLKEWIIGRNITITTVKERLRKMGAQEDNNCYHEGVRQGRGYIGVTKLHDTAADALGE